MDNKVLSTDLEPEIKEIPSHGMKSMAEKLKTLRQQKADAEKKVAEELNQAEPVLNHPVQKKNMSDYIRLFVKQQKS